MRSRDGWSEMTRPVLRSGLQVCRRDDDHLQIGLDDPDRLVLRDRRGLYAALSGVERRPGPELRPVLDRLVADGWIVDAAAAGDLARAARRRRPRLTVESDAPTTDAVTRACATAGVSVAGASSGGVAELTLVVTIGEPRRRVSDRLVREDAAHLWLAVLPSSVRIGPFVEPGRSSCLRCLDAHLGERDPRRATVLHQLEELAVSPCAEWDATLLDLGVAWAVRDAVRRLDGGVSTLRSATVTVTDELVATRREWLRHPHCGCAWG